MTRILILAMVLFAWSMSAQEPIVITEVCSSNSRIWSDEDGDYPDWIELSNIGPDTVRTAGYRISDSDEDLGWDLPDRALAPGESIVLFASSKDRTSEPWHTNFKISAGEERLYLKNPIGGMADITPPANVQQDHSFGRRPDDFHNWFDFEKPDPGTPNSPEHWVLIPELQMGIAMPTPSGIANLPIQLTIYGSSPEMEYRYTLNGETPGHDSPIWEGALTLDQPANGSGSFSFIPTSDSWTPPLRTFDQICLLRVAGFLGDVRVTEVVERTFFPDHMADDDSLLRIAIVTDEDHLFDDEEGIYVSGSSAYGNYSYGGKSWERPAHLTTVRNGEVLMDQHIGIRIHGRSSRAYPQKSIRLYADRLDEERLFTGDFFGEGAEEHRALLLRTPDRLFSQAVFTDDVVNTVLTPLNLDVMRSEPALVWINGEFWGIHGLRDRLDEQWLLYAHDYPAETEIDLLSYDSGLFVEEGSDEAWSHVLQALSDSDPKHPDTYERINTLVDLGSFADYILAELFFANRDFPSNNVRLWRPRIPGGRWRFLFFDADATMLDMRDEISLQEISASDDPAMTLLRFLVQNETFIHQFTRRANELYTTVFSPASIIAVIDRFESTYAPLMPDQADRWGYPASVEQWLNDVHALRDFAMLRPAYFMEDMDELTSVFEVFPNPAADEVKITMPDGMPFSPEEITILDLRQQVVKMYTNLQEAPVHAFNIDDLPPGMYLIRMTYAGRYFFRRVVVV